MSNKIGIRHEDKYAMERRAPLTPGHVKKVVKDHGVEVIVESSDKRVFKNEEYRSAGAEIRDNLSDCDVIMGVKEMPETFFEAGKTYIFFSHVIKGQPYNMPMLKKMMSLGCTLIDYEKVTDQDDKRVIFFGRFAGLAGMINSLWSLGKRLELQGITNNPFRNIKQAYQYDSLQEAKEELHRVSQQIREKGLPPEITPITMGFTGYGNVSKGAQEILDILPVIEIDPDELPNLARRNGASRNYIYKTVFREHHICRPIDKNVAFQLQEYYDHPEKYTSNFEKHLPHLTVLMNCMYWDDRYPRIFTRKFARELFQIWKPKIMVIGDVTCDPEGSIEFTHKGTEIEDPVFVYNPLTQEYQMGFQGDGILVMAVDILPSELPRDASQSFGDALLEFIQPLAKADFNDDLNKIDLPMPIKKAMILHKGKLTPGYQYIHEFLDLEETTPARDKD